MKFSYNLIKRLVPDAEPQAKVMNSLSMYLSPAEDPRGDVFDLELPSNRYSDLASHSGVAKEYSIISGKKFQESKTAKILKRQSQVFVLDAKNFPATG